MSEDLYGQRELLEGLVPQFVGLPLRRAALWEQRTKPAFGGCGPVVCVSGGRASGKTALLTALFDAYNGRLPLARADLAAPDLGDRKLAGQNLAPTRTASPLTHLLYLLRYNLGLRTRGGGLTFPRLSLGLLVATAWVPDEDGGGRGVAPAGLLQAQRELYAFIMAAQANARRRRELLEAWLTAVAVNLAAVVPGLDVLVQPTLETARKQLLALRARGPVRWWREQLPGQGDGVDRLVGLAVDFQTMGARRREAEEHLVAAFLDDIDEHYGAVQAGSRTALPLVLLDNVHAETGPRLLDLLKNRFVASGEDGANPVHPVIVATELGDSTAGRTFEEARGDKPWRRATDGWILRLGMNEVRDNGIRHMLRDRLGVAPYPDGLERVIDRLSGGRAGCARVLMEAAVARLRSGATPEPLSGARLLTLPCADGPEPVADRLLDLLLPGQLRVRLADMALVAVALDEAEALRLLRRHGSPRPQTDTDAERRLGNVAAELRGRHWRRDPWPEPAAPLVTDRALRALLLRRLADPRAAHAVLAERSAEAPGDPPRVARLHHALALGHTETVAAGLHELLTHLTPSDWLTSVNLVCAAPRHDEDLGAPPDASTTDRALLWIERLVRAVWRLSDPLALTPAEDDVTDVGDALRELRTQPGADPDGVLRRAETAWPEALRAGTQAPELPIPTPGPTPDPTPGGTHR
ncbi:hypothetical protein ACTWP5_28775 [Streptomyces sp. 4N509B]|uniref:hypothetical protein n=1 Tax=Streptomyces sp. 4N509B TaxID=3457413 RepID=UPI003FD2ADFF